jgi:transposase
MARPFKLEIDEDEAYLEKSLRQAKTGSQKEKLQMLWWLKSGQVNQQQELAARLSRNPSTISRWLQRYRRDGLSALLAESKASGRTRAIEGEVLEQLEARLEDPAGFYRYGEIQQWLEQLMGRPIAYKTVHKTVRYRLNAKLKVPRPRSRKQDERSVSLFKETFP